MEPIKYDGCEDSNTKLAEEVRHELELLERKKAYLLELLAYYETPSDLPANL